MQTKKYLYAVVGAQVSLAKAAQKKADEIRTKLSESTKTFGDDAQKRLDTWAGEGEEFVAKLTDSKAIDDLAAKVDFDQMQTQVNKLRDQLEDLVATWRTNFKPAAKDEAPKRIEVEEAPKPAAKKPAAKTTATKTPAKKPAAKKPAAKKPAAKTTATKKPAAKTTAKKAS